MHSCVLMSRSVTLKEEHNPLSSPCPRPRVLLKMRGRWTRSTPNYSKTVLVPEQVFGLPSTTHCATNPLGMGLSKLQKLFRREQRYKREVSCFAFSCHLLVCEKPLLTPLLLPLQIKGSEPFFLHLSCSRLREGNAQSVAFFF